jgi:cold shock CspA family protein/ribosome-associated translation inhibitor RaiA
MQTPAQIEYDGIQVSDEVRVAVERHVAALESRFGRITAARITVKGPGGHHQTGGQYLVSVRLALPDGREVHVGRTPKLDERYADLTFAVDNAFKRARRQLQDRARLMRGDVKAHEPQPIGTIARIDPSGQFGFLKAADGHEVYFNCNSIVDGGSSIVPGARVSYVEEIGEKGPQASTVKMLGKHRLRA